ncbi:baculoviral IAP repeat-containing protein 8-like [Clavelina lepadiformis]|uniref:baculoviral IAP repeat-containing protein 8-like n=1 Tax=Clavelina lepadiformis TaxID=159417 RepID=UPI00404389A3
MDARQASGYHSSDIRQRKPKHNQNQASYYRHPSSAQQPFSSVDHSSMFPCLSPCTPPMSLYEKRLLTYANWPHHIDATPEELAAAGFFYLKEKDRVKCFYCNGGLQNWKKDERPFYEHAKWYPNCEFLLQQKGIEYAHCIASLYPNLNRPSIFYPTITSNPTTSSHSRSQVASCSSQDRSPVVADSIDSVRMQSVQPSQSLNDKIDDEMKGHIVQESAGFGFDWNLVRQVVTRKLKRDNGKGYDSVMALVEDILGAEETLNNTEQTISQSIEEESRVTEVFESNISREAKTPSAGAALMGLPPAAEDLEPMTSSSTFNSLSNASDINEKIDNLKSERTCKVCLDRDANCVFVPCNHLSCCIECASALRKCPICRVKLEKIIKVYRW